MIHLDFETYSRIDLTKVGAHRYAEDPSTEALMASLSVNEDHPIVVDLFRNPIPERIQPYLERMENGEPIVAHNAEFERCICNMLRARHGWPKLRRSQFHCTAAMSAAAGGPRGLDAASAWEGLQVMKDPRGRQLMRRFSMPQKDGSRILPTDDPENYTKFMEYGHQDVIVETALYSRLPRLHPFARHAFLLDSLLNDRGFPVDLALIEKGMEAVAEFTQAAVQRVEELTGGIKPSKRNAILTWLKDSGAELDTLQAQEIKDLMEDPASGLPDEVREVLSLRLETSRAGLSKLLAMKRGACRDGRVRGGFLFYGAHTGRWSGQRVQPHNFARGNPEEQDRALDLLMEGGADLLRMFYPNPLVVLSESIRGFIATPHGRRWIIADYTAIEARALAWYAGAASMLARFMAGVDLYKWMASLLFGVPESEVTSEQRRIGKNIILGCGYGMGGPSFVIYCARVAVYITEQFAIKAVRSYRAQVPEIVYSWYATEDAFVAAITNPGKVYRPRNRDTGWTAPVTMVYDGRRLIITLPSGRPIYYNEPKFKPAVWGTSEEGARVLLAQKEITFKTLWNGRPVREHTHGSKIVENIIQGIAWDLMVEGMTNAEREGYPVSLTVHDEVGADVPEDVGDVGEFERLITVIPDWGKGIPLQAKGFAARRYRKD